MERRRRNFSESVKNIGELMKNDFKSAFKNPIVVFVLVVLIALPSLYALLNIDACWDPYENTGDLSFAIANIDKGTTYDGESFNVGNDLIDGLKNNSDFNWQFVSKSDLENGVKNGTYYAGIIIPENFSETLISITTDNPQSAKLIYIVNEKTNPTAAKLSDTGAKAVYNKMNAEIVEFINLAAYGKLGDLQSSLASGSTQLSSGAVQLSSGASQVSSGADDVTSSAKDVSNGVNEVNSGSKDVSNGASKVTSGASKVKSGSSQVSEGASKVSESASQVSEGSSKVQESAKQLDQASSQLPDPLKPYAESSVKIANASSQVASGSNDVAQGSVKLAESSTKLANGANDIASGASGVAEGSSKLANGAVTLAEGSGKLAEGSLSLAAGSELLANSAASALFSAASSLSGAAGSLSDITGVDEDQIGNYFYAPIELEEHKLYDTSNYGSQVAPFYIVLSMWVGAVITCVMIKPGLSSGTKYTPLEMYFGKLLLFIIMSLLQAAVTIVGAMIMGIDIDSLGLFIFSASLVSVVFMIVMYSLISALGQVGKGLGVILLVLQISGTGGIYPIGLMNDFFQVLYPYLPMTHGITLVREALLGVFWPNFFNALYYMIGLGIGTVIIAVIVKEFADKASHYFEEQLEDSGLF